MTASSTSLKTLLRTLWENVFKLANKSTATAQSSAAQPSSSSSTAHTNFDIVSHYDHLLSKDSSITPAIAAIESLISLLSSSSLTTVSETLSLLSTASATLLASQSNPLPVSAGTDLFQRYLVTSFNQTPISLKSSSDFSSLRTQLISNSKLFVARAKQARSKIARYALSFLGGEDANESKTTILTYGSSRVVYEVLRYAAEKGRYFNVIQVFPSGSLSATQEQVSMLRAAGVSIATVPLAQLAMVLSSLSTNPGTRDSDTILFLLGTGAVLENGSVVSGMGSSLIAQVAKVHGIPLFVATESYKFARQFPVSYGERELQRMGTQQDILKFSEDKEVGEEKEFSWRREEELVDVTAPGLISGLVTENGIMTPNAVAEELIKLWY